MNIHLYGITFISKTNFLSNPTTSFSPQAYARTAGVLYLIIILAGFAGEMLVRNQLVVSGNAAATYDHILHSPVLWRLGIAGDLIMHICDIPLMLILYVLLKPVHKHLAMLALLFTVMQTAVLVANKSNLLTPLFLVGDADYLKNLGRPQLEAFTYLSIKMHEYGFGIGLIFFGCAILVSGYLIIKSGYLPKWIGIMMQIAGLCYLINSFSLILAPQLANKLFPLILLPSFIAELSFCLRLLIKGVNVLKWKEKANQLHA